MCNPSSRFAALIVTSLLAGACAKGASDFPPGSESTKLDDKPSDAPVAADARWAVGQEAAGKLAETRKVIRTGRIELVVTSYDEARTKLEAILKSAGGYIDSTQVTHSQGAVSNATIVLRLPSKEFGAIVPMLRALGEISSETTNAADITDQYIDVSARLASAKVLEKRLLELAADRNGKVESVLAVERELARVRGEIESHEGHIRQWNDQIAMSTITLGLSTKAPEIAAAPSRGLGDRISGAFSSSIGALRDFGAWIAISGIAFLPWLILVIPGFLLGRRAWRRFGPRVLPTAVARPPQPAAVPPPAQ
jgi:hypothetical protein